MSNQVFCEFLKEKVDENKLIKGIISFNADGTFTEGMFSPSFNIVSVECADGIVRNAMSREIVPPIYIETAAGVFKSQLVIDALHGLQPYLLTDRIKSQFEYSISSERIKVREEFIKNFKPANNDTIKYLRDVFNTFSVGIEFETASGLIPKDIQLESGLVPLRDGSIPGFEYVTIPLKGDIGAQMCINALSAIEEYTTTDTRTCALHFHFGGVPRTEGFLVALWRVISVYQDALYELQPPYKMLNWGFKKKSYSKPYPASISAKLQFGASDKENFGHIFEYLSQGHSYSNYNSDLKNVEHHPSDPDGRHKWNVNTRYSILNLIPIIFGNKQTVEFRLSEITNNKETVINELCMLASILKFTMINQKQINESARFLYEIDFRDISAYTDFDGKMVDYIRNYISTKKGFIGRYFKYDSFDDFNMNDFRVEFPFRIETIPFNIDKKAAVSFYNKHRDYETDATCPVVHLNNHNPFVNFDGIVRDLNARQINNTRRFPLAPNNMVVNDNGVLAYTNRLSRFSRFSPVNTYSILGVDTPIDNSSFSRNIIESMIENLTFYKSAVESGFIRSELSVDNYNALREIVLDYNQANGRLNLQLIKSFVESYLASNENINTIVKDTLCESFKQLSNCDFVGMTRELSRIRFFYTTNNNDCRWNVSTSITADINIVTLFAISFELLGLSLFTNNIDIANDAFSEKARNIFQTTVRIVNTLSSVKNLQFLSLRIGDGVRTADIVVENKILNNFIKNIVSNVETL